MKASSVDIICIICFVISLTGVASTLELSNLHYVGCYDTSYSLTQDYHHPLIPTTLAECVLNCQGRNMQYAGVEASDNFCYCGNDIAEESAPRDNSECNVPCSDNATRTCGGSWLISVYDIRGVAVSVDLPDNVDFLVGLSTGVRLYHSSNLSSYDTLMTTPDWSYSVDYHFSKNLVFVHTKNKIYKTTKTPKSNSVAGALSKQLVKSVTQCEGFAVDWVQDRLYWANCEEGKTSIMSSSLDGANDRTVVDVEGLPGRNLKRMEIDPYEGVVFWTADGVMHSVETSGESFSPNLTKPELTVRALALDLRARRVYYVGTLNSSTSLYSMDYHGGDEVDHFSAPQLRSVYGLGVLRDKVFWVNYANVRDVIYEAPINLTEPSHVKVLKIIDRAVWHMRVAHPSLQNRRQTNPCHEKGCSYSCVRGKVTRCTCPPGQILYEDGVTCFRPVGHPTAAVGTTAAATVYFISVLLILLVVLASLILVKLGDKYWSLLESKLVRVPYPRSDARAREEDLRPVASDYHTADDNVNLI